jgi:hypothetical protein
VRTKTGYVQDTLCMRRGRLCGQIGYVIDTPCKRSERVFGKTGYVQDSLSKRRDRVPTYTAKNPAAAKITKRVVFITERVVFILLTSSVLSVTLLIL